MLTAENSTVFEVHCIGSGKIIPQISCCEKYLITSGQGCSLLSGLTEPHLLFPIGCAPSRPTIHPLLVKVDTLLQKGDNELITPLSA